ncbi:DNA-directed DNA polymerase gamma mip1 [Coemansia sp. RSA 1358]|nr:DNA-directed DNA polymerase gamma mip1 [Coemansia sp. RSA 1358]
MRRPPVLECAVIDALKKSIAGDQYVISRTNWMVQSSSVEYLHLLLVSMSYLPWHYNIDIQ